MGTTTLEKGLNSTKRRFIDRSGCAEFKTAIRFQIACSIARNNGIIFLSFFLVSSFLRLIKYQFIFLFALYRHMVTLEFQEIQALI